jgi:hypothetical protein
MPEVARFANHSLARSDGGVHFLSTVQSTEWSAPAGERQPSGAYPTALDG